MFINLLINTIMVFVGFYLLSLVNKILSINFIYLYIDNLFFITLIITILYTIAFDRKEEKLNIDKVVNQEEFYLTDEQISKFKKLPITLNFSNSVEDESFNIVDLKFDKENKKFYDEVKILNNGYVEIYNKSGFIDLKKYRSKEEEIKHYIESDNIKINKEKNNSIIIDIFDRFPKNIKFDDSFLKDYEIFMGFDEKGKMEFIEIKNLSHFAISGSAGAGKSVLLDQINAGLIYNLNVKFPYELETEGENKGKETLRSQKDVISKIYLFDLKQVSFSKFRKVSQKIKVSTDMNEIYKNVEEVYLENKKRQNNNVELDVDKQDYEKIILEFDEFAEIMDSCPSATDKENYQKFQKFINNMMSIIQTARSQNINVFICSQKITTDSVPSRMRTNLQSRILMKSKDNESIIACLGSNEPIEEIGCNPKIFNYGRMVYLQDSPKGVLTLYLQSIFIDRNYYKHIMEIRNMKTLTEDEIKSEEYLEDFKDSIILTKIPEIKENIILKDDLVDFRKNLWKLTETIDKEDKRKNLRSQLTKINTKLKEDCDLLIVKNELIKIEKEIFTS